jgi:cytochrome c biogenesis factor
MEKTLELIKKYQRPTRTVIWTILIIIAFLVCLFSSKPCNEGFITEAILFAMFADMGVYTISRTIEKLKNKDTDANQG